MSTAQSLSADEIPRRIQVISAREKNIKLFLRGELDEKTFKNLYELSLRTEVRLRSIYEEPACNVYAEELRRLDLPQDASYSRLAAFAVKKRLQESVLRYSRSCFICLCDTPRQRSFFAGCGHVVCRACAEQLVLDAISSTTYPLPACPLCRKVSQAVTLVEEPSHDYDKFVVDFRKNRKEAITFLLHAERMAKGAGGSMERDLLAMRALDRELCRDSYLALFRKSIQDEVNRRGNVCFGRVIEEEARRLDALLSQRADRGALAYCAVQAAWRIERLPLIKELRDEEETNVSRPFSRECSICTANNPRHRSVFTKCGHVFCRACADLIDSCRLCGAKSASVNLFEDVIEKVQNEDKEDENVEW